jgi:hypothetical protein
MAPVTAEDDLRRHARVVLNLLKYELPDLRLVGDSEERAKAFEDATDKLERILWEVDYPE